MVVIKKIQEPVSELFFNGELVGEITTSLQLNDCLIQIKQGKLEGYHLTYEGEDYPIRPNGRIKGAANVYPLLSRQMKLILGF